MVREELTRIETTLEGLRLELFSIERHVGVVPPQVHHTWVFAKLERLDQWVASEAGGETDLTEGTPSRTGSGARRGRSAHTHRQLEQMLRQPTALRDSWGTHEDTF